MPNIAFLPLYQIERASSRYRIFQFIPYLEQSGYRCTVLPAPQRNLWRRLFYVPRLLILLWSHELLFIQKRMLPDWLLALLKLWHPAIIFDLDDAVYLRPQHQARINKMLSIANLVIAGNSELGRYVQQYNSNVVVIPSVVDSTIYRPGASTPDSDDARIVLGWIGSDPNRGDFVGMQPVLDWLGETYRDKVVLRIIAARTLEMSTSLSIEWIPWSLTGSIPTLQSIDIGLMPLPDTEWNRGKCGFKLIQYMAVGATAVASPTGVNSEIIQDGQTGFLAENEVAWKKALAQLIENKQRRLAMGQSARERIEKEYSVQAVLPDLTTAINKVAFWQRT